MVDEKLVQALAFLAPVDDRRHVVARQHQILSATVMAGTSVKC